MNVIEAAAVWLAKDERGQYIGPPVSEGWRKGRASLIKHVVEAVGSRLLSDFCSADVWRIQQHCQQISLKPSSINHITHSVLRGMLRDLESVGLIDESVFDRIRRAKKLRLSRDPKAKHFTAEQRDKAITAFDGHWAQPIVAFLFLTGCRVSEMAGLQWRDVDLEAGEIAIRRGRIGKNLVTECKTEHSQRLIGIPDRLVEILAVILHGADPTEYVFKGRHGKLPVDVHTLRRQIWQPTLKAAGLPPLAIHGARHTLATTLLTNGVPIAQVAAHLGDTMRVVERTYAHVMPRFDINSALSGRPTHPPTALSVVVDRAAVVAERPRLRLVKG